MTGPRYGADNPRMSKRRVDRAERARKQFISDLGAVVTLPAGRRFVMTFLEQYCYLTSDIDTNPKLAGRRSVGVDLKRLLVEHHPKQWRLAFNEACEQAEEDGAHERDAELEARRDEETTIRDPENYK